ncbi:ChaN family lipoprotein [Parapedobacter sp. DT-150]|uniref:ChaN family lipoprotein n=1 Tax=Parapedobacter sp. DT-150 TaxID=3396162 RepID=UPI003F1AFDB3
MTTSMLCYLPMLLPVVAAAQMDSTRYRVYDTRTQQEITLPQLADALRGAEVVFFGEEHDDSVAHVLQHELLKAMDERYPGVALSMEMFVSDDQLVLDEYLGGLITERNLRKDAVLWNNYDDYHPMVEYAKAHQIPVLAANAPSRYTNRVTREGLESLEALDKTAQALLAPLPIDTLTGPYYKKFADLMGGHEGMGNLKIYQSQNLWDATMAFRIRTFKKRKSINKILHINGRFHSDEQLGTIAQLRKYAPRMSVSNISCFPHEGLSNPNWRAFSHLGDYIILTATSVAKTF